MTTNPPPSPGSKIVYGFLAACVVVLAGAGTVKLLLIMFGGQ